jgi:rod shape determining protein RodA
MFFCAAILVFIKPDLGGTMVLLLIWLGILSISGIKLKHFAILLICFMLVAGFSWHFLLKDYQKDRVISFVFPYDVLGSAWSQTQTKIAIGSGKIIGEGIGRESQVQYGFLPEPQTDFIFSVIAEELGFVGVLVFLGLFGVVLYRLVMIMKNSSDDFAIFTVGGITLLLFIQFFVNVGAEIGILPLTGVTVPFVSYGGSSMIINLMMIGIAQSMIVRRY